MTTILLLHCVIRRLGRYEPDIVDEIRAVVRAQRRKKLVEVAVRVLEPAIASFAHRAHLRMSLGDRVWAINCARNVTRLLTAEVDQQIVELVVAEGADNVLPVVQGKLKQEYDDAYSWMCALYVSVRVQPVGAWGTLGYVRQLTHPSSEFHFQWQRGEKYMTS